MHARKIFHLPKTAFKSKPHWRKAVFDLRLSLKYSHYTLFIEINMHLTHALSSDISSLFSYTYFCNFRVCPAQCQVFQLLFVFFEQSLLQTKAVGWAISTKAKFKANCCSKCLLEEVELLSLARTWHFVSWQGIKRFLCCESSATCKRNVSEICEASQIFPSHCHLNKTSKEGEVISQGIKNIQSKYISGCCFGKAKPDKQPLDNSLQKLTFYLGLWT